MGGMFQCVSVRALRPRRRWRLSVQRKVYKSIHMSSDHRIGLTAAFRKRQTPIAASVDEIYWPRIRSCGLAIVKNGIPVLRVHPSGTHFWAVNAFFLNLRNA